MCVCVCVFGCVFGCLHIIYVVCECKHVITDLDILWIVSAWGSSNCVRGCVLCKKNNLKNFLICSAYLKPLCLWKSLMDAF